MYIQVPKYPYLIKKFIYSNILILLNVCMYIKYNKIYIYIIIFFPEKYYFKKTKSIPKVLIFFRYFQCNFIIIIEHLKFLIFSALTCY